MSDEFHIWKCLTCDEGATEYTPEQFVNHVNEVHHLGNNVTGKRWMMQYIDATKWYESVYEWKVGGLEWE